MIAAVALVVGRSSLHGGHRSLMMAVSAFQPILRSGRHTLKCHDSTHRLRIHGRNNALFSSSSSTRDEQSSASSTSSNSTWQDDRSSSAARPTPWRDPRVEERIKTRRRNNNNRFRQHVNPLARQYQQPTELSGNWPSDVFDSVENKPLHIDIGCAKGGFLLEYAASEYAAKEKYNYLGLEIRPMVAQFAKERLSIHNLTGKLDFLGCNVNFDLDRLLGRYHQRARPTTTVTTTASDNKNDDNAMLLLHRVTIQYPDPHFKKQHAKRRVVTPALVNVIAKYMPPLTGVVFLQSDVQTVLDDMRDRFAEASLYFEADVRHDKDEYLPENPLGVPTEREVSVIDKGLPVYRVLFRRTATPYQEQVRGEESKPVVENNLDPDKEGA